MRINASIRGRRLPLVSVVLSIVFLIAGFGSERFAVAAPPVMVSGVVEGKPVEGLELIRGTDRRIVLGRDGWLHDFDPQRTEHSLRVREGGFEPLAALPLRSRLVEEFGRDFDIVATKHFLVVTPVGRGSHWPQTFERLHRDFTAFFSLRGVRVLKGNFPMVAIVMPDYESMQRYLATLNIRSPQALGVYDRASNRIVMYDHGASHGGVATTICHEAAHQSAFNTGVHSRFAETPSWIIEGVGCLFQSSALIQGRSGATRRDRCDAELLATFEETYRGRDGILVRDLESLIGGERMFSARETIDSAYALSWALTFYLVEIRGAEFAELLNFYGRRPPLEKYDTMSRLRDFEQLVGHDIASVGQQLLRFYDRL